MFHRKIIFWSKCLSSYSIKSVNVKGQQQDNNDDDAAAADNNNNKCKKKLRFRHELTANDTFKTAKITKTTMMIKGSLPTRTSPKCQCAVE